MPAVLFFRTGNGPNATRAMYAVCIVYATCVVDPICIGGRDLHRGWGLRYGTTWVIGAISILLEMTLECGLFCVKDIE